MISRKIFTKEQALQKIRHYAAYQERCHYEIKEKLYSFALRKTDVEEIVSILIAENYLNEERFAVQYATGKFRIKQWGRNKIKYELQLKKISPYCIKKAMTAINETDYLDTLKKLAEKKWKNLKAEQYVVRHAKTQTYLLNKGYDFQLVKAVIADLKAEINS